jgi:periplasmic protein TonB
MKLAVRAALLAVLVGLGGCGALKPGTKDDAGKPAATKPADEAAGKPSDKADDARQITAQTPTVRGYRKTGARHIYKTYPQQIYKGKIPPLVYAVVVTETEVDASGRVTGVFFSRTPSHAPEVGPQIAVLIRAASPLPSPGKVGAHTYVETWLWDKSGKFQLDSLTEGQRSR